MSSTSSSEDEDEARRRAAMASCVMSAEEVLASAPKKPRPRPTHVPTHDTTAEDAICTQSAGADRPFQKMTSDRLHSLLTKTLDSRITDSVWNLPTQQRISHLHLQVFAGASTMQSSRWPPAPRDDGQSAARPTDVAALVALADLANKGAQGNKHRAGRCTSCGAVCAVCAGVDGDRAGRKRERKSKSERKSKRSKE